MLVPMIELSEVEHYPYYGDEYPDITHAQLVNFKVEVPRLHSGKTGGGELWFAKGFIRDDHFYELEGYQGVMIELDDLAILVEFILYPTTGKSINSEILRIASQFAIDKEHILGTIVEVGIE